MRYTLVTEKIALCDNKDDAKRLATQFREDGFSVSVPKKYARSYWRIVARRTSYIEEMKL